MIKRFGKGRHSHAAMLFCEDGTWVTYEFREFKGWRRRTLAEQVAEFPDQIDVFRPLPALTVNQEQQPRVWGEDRIGRAHAVLKSWKGLPYGWGNIAKLCLHYLPIFRLMPQEMTDEKETDVFVCSTAVCVALRKSYRDPVPNLADEMVTPTDLARSALLEYQFSIKEKP